MAKLYTLALNLVNLICSQIKNNMVMWSASLDKH